MSIEEKVELSDIIDYAMRDWDNYIDECREEEIPPIDTFEEWIADAVLRNGYRKQSEWISVDERLPDENGRYLVNVDISHMAFEDLFTVAIMAYGKSHGFYVYNEVEKVTHWMPLPEAPKMKGGAE